VQPSASVSPRFSSEKLSRDVVLAPTLPRPLRRRARRLTAPKNDEAAHTPRLETDALFPTPSSSTSRQDRIARESACRPRPAPTARSRTPKGTRPEAMSATDRTRKARLVPPFPGVSSPTTFQDGGSSLYRGCLPRRRAPSGFLNLLTHSSAHVPSALFHAESVPGVPALRGFPLPVAATTFAALYPRVRSKTIARRAVC
jgi:hypothetical protein